MEIKFYNDLGSITFSGGYAENAWCMTACDGLTFSGKTFKTVRYTGDDGCETVDMLENQRVITLSGDVKVTKNFAADYALALAVLGREGTLSVTSGGVCRRIGAVCSEFSETDRNSAFRVFCIQFVCDNPFFESDSQEEFYIYKSIPKLNSDFAFPGAFSQRISGGRAVCFGSAATEPVISVNTGTAGGKLTVTNKTSGESISLDYTAHAGESITLDVKNRTVRSSDGTDLTSCLSDESFFEGFRLLPGENELEVKTDTAYTGLTVACRYRPLYREAGI